MSITNMVRSRTIFLKTGDAAKYLNYRSLDISGEALNLSGGNVRELAKNEKLKHNKTTETGNFLFKTSWLERYLKAHYGSDYVAPEARSNRFIEFDPGANVQNDSSAPVLFASGSAVDKTPSAVGGDFLGRIKNSPPLIYLSALLVGFAAGAGTNIGDRLIEWGYFSDRISVINPISGANASMLATAIQKEGPETELGLQIRELEAKSQGPFKPVEKEIRLHLLDMDKTNPDFDPDFHTYVIERAAAVCSGSGLHGAKISINASSVVLTGQKAIGLVRFDAFLMNERVCAFGKSGAGTEHVVVNRQTFDKYFNVNTSNTRFVDVVALIENG